MFNYLLIEIINQVWDFSSLSRSNFHLAGHLIATIDGLNFLTLNNHISDCIQWGVFATAGNHYPDPTSIMTQGRHDSRDLRIAPLSHMRFSRLRYLTTNFPPISPSWRLFCMASPTQLPGYFFLHFEPNACLQLTHFYSNTLDSIQYE